MKVFLGGTTNGTTWREKLIKKLKIDYFNPIVDDWNEKAYEEELRQRKICDYCLYCITPKMIGYYSIAEVVDDSNKRPNNTILCILKEDENIKFNKFQLKSLVAIAKMIYNNKSKVFTNLNDVATFLNNKGSK